MKKTYLILAFLAFFGVFGVFLGLLYVFEDEIPNTSAQIIDTQDNTVKVRDKSTVIDQVNCLLQRKDENWGYSKKGIVSELEGFGYDRDAIEYAKTQVLDKEDFVEQARACVRTFRKRVGMTDEIIRFNLKYLGFSCKQIDKALK